MNEGPAHGYEIERKIRDRGIRVWTQIGFSSIYHILRKLKQAGYVSQTANVAGGKLQQVYQLTSSGRQALYDQIRQSLVALRKGEDEFDIAIANTVNMPSGEIRSLLRERIARLEREAAGLEHLRDEKIANGMPNLPAVTVLFDRPIALLRAEKEFLENYINRF
ncbi:MAG: PadR family transcriptional regulator [FCB group bacterium]|nr:PadR family transcriptional regulator [FCB group bacterium]